MISHVLVRGTYLQARNQEYLARNIFVLLLFLLILKIPEYVLLVTVLTENVDSLNSEQPVSADLKTVSACRKPYFES